MALTLTTRFLDFEDVGGIPQKKDYTQSQFAESFDKVFGKSNNYSLTGSTLTLNEFGVLAGGYFVSGVGSETYTLSTDFVYVYAEVTTDGTTATAQIVLSSAVLSDTGTLKYGLICSFQKISSLYVDLSLKVATLWTGSILGGDPAPINFSSCPQYDYFILYLGSQGRGVRADKNLTEVFIQGSTTGVFSEISNTGKTTYSGQLPQTGATILKRQVHFQSGSHSTIDNTNLVGIKGVKS